MTYDMQITARDMANYYRNLVATGWAQDKNGYAPTAKIMNALAMSSWFGELKNVDLDEKATYNSNVQNSAPNFANLVIGDATKVGCSVKKCLKEGFSVAVCQFDGTAPTPDDPLYTAGKTCSGCRVTSKTCHKALPGICI
ncbi:hypothetical protein ANCCAN_06776 [Ancylostoma caninum]|uniref:SCP domain-containing protein n=1 Tax=Ancylostoma caninum TaxID=29170 RepID=A0A368GUD0_ANCCA|nr:hypothetical protein ANCCAN_06776 [Ancylostoma caninum]